jgi:ubiquinone/menaquinone biosynthesis C-methylase UbiE
MISAVQGTRSYDFDRFSDGDRRAELARLQRQATVLIDREMALLAGLGLGPGSATLEIGCGPGFVTGAIADVVAPGHTVGLDASADLLRFADTVVAPEHPNLRFVRGDAYRTGLPDGGFDFIYNRLVYQHLAAPLDALREARRLTRPGGKVCVLDVDDGWLTLEPMNSAFEQVTRLALDAQAKNGGDRCIGRKLPALMRQAGFRQVDLQVMSVSSLELGLAPFLDITMRFKAIQIGTPQAAALASQAIETARQEQAFGVVGVFVAVGTT